MTFLFSFLYIRKSPNKKYITHFNEYVTGKENIN